MKPKLLRMAGIGPFPSEITINFDHLEAIGLYLVVGPTGAGKTTIFEAMSYALFATVPSNRILETTFLHQRSFIEFTFSHDGGNHRVMRDFTKTNGDFYEQLPKGTRVAQRKPVTEHVENLLKLTADQFLKIILLPQGQFQKFLVANTKDKEQILQRIFGTEVYDRIALNVSEYAKDLSDELAKIREQLAHKSRTVANDVGSLRTNYPELDLPNDDMAFEEAQRIVTNAIPRAQRAQQIASASVQQLSGDLARNKDLERLFDDHQRLTTLRATAKATALQLKSATKAVDAHVRAERALRQKDDYDSAVLQRDTTVSERDGLLRDLRREATRLKINVPQVSTFRTAIDSSKNLPEEFGTMSRAVTTALEVLDRISGLQDELDAAHLHMGALETEIEGANKELVSLEAHKIRLALERTTTNSLAGDVAQLQRRVDALDLQLTKADVSHANRAVATATTRVSSAKRTLLTAEIALTKAQKTNELHLAGQLAQHLEDGDNCPVCGATDHPKPARLTRRIDVQAFIDRHAAAKTQVSQTQRDLREAQSASNEALKAGLKLPTVAAQTKLRNHLQRALVASRVRVRTERQYDTAVAKLNEAKGKKTELTAELRGENATIKRVSNLLAQAKASAPRPITEAHRRDTRQALTKLNGLVRKKHATDEMFARQTTKLATLDFGINDALRKEGFRTLEAATSAALTPKVLLQFTKLLAASKERDDKINGLAARVEGHNIPKQRPDTKVIEQELHKLRDEQTAASTQAIKMTSLSARLDELAVALAELRPRAELTEERLMKANGLATTMNTGVGVGEKRRYRLQEWIQRRLFHEVCLVASEQLRTLTAGRFTITLRADADLEKKRAHGLDLYVLDSFNGKRRSVGSLSGGETFLASLALALALAEVVQAHAGGIKLPCLFIDEGFGSLDQETLECAMDALLKLQHSGRTVGVITHVEAMQRQLPIGIRVIKSDSGSRLEFPLLQ